ncbi:MAG: hypothetical protein N3F63_05430 [Thermoplasmata archaeon]|nr:hypothetical protein [Thermoplasmata archaeon]
MKVKKALPLLLLFVLPLLLIAASIGMKWNIWGIVAGITWLGTGFVYLLTYE